ncbi:hypothetical protein K502DRAFT_350186 [Neoconidiobolus thromboides FSU 785]|nr:hypothetical protein K502DRAFT_350186 [Neoconidiobolus thromboides FSU 785]
MSYDNNKLYFTEDCLIQTNNCFKDSTKHNYFEIEALNLEDDAQFHFGLALNIKDNNFKDSSILLNIYSKKIELYGKPIEWINFPTIDEGDVIGCLYHSSPRNEAMFTYNGEEIITLKFGFNKAKLFPTIYGIKGCFINYNFGREPFHYQPANYYNYGVVKPSTKSEEPPNYS